MQLAQFQSENFKKQIKHASKETVLKCQKCHVYKEL